KEVANLQDRALAEFEDLLSLLTRKALNAIVYDDLPFPHKPDAVFVGDWLCTLPDGTVAVFPLAAPNRTDEKRDDVVADLSLKFDVSDVEVWSEYEAEGFFLEGTGSMVFDHGQKLIYACLSPRTHQPVLEKFAAAHRYRAVTFRAASRARPLQHTSLMMSVGEGYALLCADCFADEDEWIGLKHLHLSTGHEIIPI